MKKTYLLCLIFFSCLQYSYSQDGKLDSSFGYNGFIPLINFAKPEIVPLPSTGKQVLALPDGSMYIFYEKDGITYITKRNPNGAADISFGKNGLGTAGSSLYQFAQAVLQSDGKIVGVGSNGDFVLFRLNRDGSADQTFGDNSIQVSDFESGDDYASAIAIQSDGKIVVGGTSIQNYVDKYVISRYNSDGSPDSSFGKNGILYSDIGISSIAIQKDHKIVVVGSAIVRYNTDGSIDSTFGEDGKQTTEFLDGNGKPLFFQSSAVSLQKDGKIVVAGTVAYGGDVYKSNFAVLRFNIDGSPDNSFAEDGKQITEFLDTTGSHLSDRVTSLAINGDGKILLAGSTGINIKTDFALVRYNTDGSLDTSFSKDGKQTTDFDMGHDMANSIALQSDGRILVAGTDAISGSCESDACAKFAVARYNTTGLLDSTFDQDGKLTGAYDKSYIIYGSAAIQKDGKIVVTGTATDDNFIARYNSNGTLDKTFNKEGFKLLDFSIGAVALQNDEKIVVLGSVLARFNTDGSRDNSFSGNLKLATNFSSLLTIQEDGKIVVVGTLPYTDTSSGDNSDVFALARYNINGSIDSTFNNGQQTPFFGRQNNIPRSVAIGPDGKIAVAGFAGSGGTSDDFAVARYNTNGSLDSTFNGTGKQTAHFPGDGSRATSVVIQRDNKIVVGGFSVDEGGKLVRYNIDGKLDSSFSDDGIASALWNTLVVQNDNKIIGSVYNIHARYNTDGNSDTTFGNSGIQLSADNINSIAIVDNMLYVAGTGSVARHLLNDSRNIAPNVSITTPANNATYLAPAAHIKLSAAAGDKDGTISKVEFYNGTTLLHTETAAPYGFVWRNVGLGNYTLTAKAYDDSGLMTTSAPVHISVVPNKPPTVNIVTPKNNEAFAAPGYIHFEATAKDIDGRITKVEFYNGATLLRTEYKAPYTYVWKNVPRGKYTVNAVATDNWGAHSTSAPVTVKVVLPPETIVSNKPIAGKTTLDVEGPASLTLHPNPAHNTVTIVIGGLQWNKQAHLSLSSASGIIFKTMQINASKTVQLDVSSLSKGVYLVKIQSGAKMIARQFVKL